jgi:uncharacterized repeat protein (TIGR03803 family)
VPTNRVSSRFAVVLCGSLFVVALSAGDVAAQSVNILFSFGDGGPYTPGEVLLAQGRDGRLYGTTNFGGASDDGTVFRQNANGSNTTLHEFNGTDGKFPFGGVTLGRDGSFYGTTEFGGAFNAGVLYKVTPAGVLTVLYSFTGGSDGKFGFAPPIEGSDGNFYGTTSTSVYRYLPSSGGVTPIYSNSNDGSNFNSSPLQAADGTLYIAAFSGGPKGCGSILRLTIAGTLIRAYGFDCGTLGSNPYGALIQAANGDIYGTTPNGGSFGAGNIFKLNAAGLQVVYSFTPNGDGFQTFAGLSQGTDGNFYGASSAGGSFNGGTLFQLTASGNYSKIYDFSVPSGPQAPPVQHTNGTFYGVTSGGGAYGTGSFYSLSQGLTGFVESVQSSGKVGSQAELLGQGLTGATNVTFNGVPASFTVRADTYLTATVPANATTGLVVVTMPSVSLKSNKNFQVIK